jgi:hypothetical protein
MDLQICVEGTKSRKRPTLFVDKQSNGKPQIKMKASIVITLIIMGGLLILAPVISLERQRDRVAEFYKKNGNAAILAAAMDLNNTYDWTCIAAGAVLVLVGVRQALRSRDVQPV